MRCAYSKCSKTFEQTTHNKIYCSPECRRLATNAKLMEKYYKKRKRENAKDFLCEQCGVKLSSYNKGYLCYSCINKEKSNIMNDIMISLNNNV